MSKRTRQFIGIIFAIVAYYIIHEGAHLVMALIFHAFKGINFMWLGIQVDVYRDRLTDMQLGIFCIAGVTATPAMQNIPSCISVNLSRYTSTCIPSHMKFIPLNA